MKAFHDDQSIKDKYLARVQHHMKLDNLKGCAVGCTLEAYDHARYVTELGIPEWLAHVENTFFERMSEEKSRSWAFDFLSAIKPGVDLEKIRVPFIVSILESTLQSMDACVFDREKDPEVVKALEGSKNAVTQMMDAHMTGTVLQVAARSAESAVWAAAQLAESAARSAESVVWAARAVESAARLARSLKKSAVWAAESVVYDSFADRLLELLKGIKE